MKLPNHDSARIAPEKITNYLLNPIHEEGGSKARLLQHFGFSFDDPSSLSEALLAHCATHEVLETERFEYGTKYKIRGPLTTPDGRNPIVLTVWNILTGEQIPRFVTLVPLKEAARR
jgi:hypothetical protein